MTLLEFKGLAATIILFISLSTGFASIGFANRYQRQLEIGDAIANGIFIGAAVFHLLPNAISLFRYMGFHFVYTKSIALLVFSFITLWLIEQILLRRKERIRRQTDVWLLTITLSIHALIAGAALGISETFSIVSIIFIAIIAHKGFETFAFAVNLHRQLKKGLQISLMLIGFSLITPIGIGLGLIGDVFLHTRLDNILTGCFNAFAAGSFLYIGTLHSHHLHEHKHHKKCYSRPIKFTATVLGILAMMFVGFWA